MKHAPARRLIVVSFTLFIVLGVSTGVTGVAWPTMRLDFNRPLPDLGVLLAVGTGGYFLAGLAAGWITRRIGIGRALIGVLIIGSISLTGYGVVPSWPLLLICAVGVGFSGGTLDSLTNAYVALNHDARTMGLLHAFFGIGATGGPVLAAAVLARGMSWKTAFFILAVAEVLLIFGVFRVRRQWPAPSSPNSPGGHGRQRFDATVLALLGVFVLYVGIEITAGQWSYSLLTESRGMGEFAAGIWVAMYWGGMTVGRLTLGVIGDRIDSSRYLRLSMVGTVLGGLFFWLDPLSAGFVGLPLLGYSLAGVFPVLVTLTPGWVGAENAESIIGYQIAAASAGSALLPWVAGRIVDSAGLEALGPYLVATSLVMALLNWFLDRVAVDHSRLAHSRSPFSRSTKDKNSSQS